MPSSRVTVVITYRAHPGKEPAAQAALAGIVGTVLAKEPDCLGISMYEDTRAPGRFLLHERWTSQEAYTGPHFQTPHLQAFIAAAPSLFTGPPDISFWRELPPA